MKHIPSAWLGGKGEGPVGWGLSGRGIIADFFVFMLNEIFSFNLCPSLMTLQLSLLFSCPVFTGETDKQYRAYCSTYDWPGARFPQSCLDLKVPRVCRALGADHQTTLGKVLKFSGKN